MGLIRSGAMAAILAAALAPAASASLLGLEVSALRRSTTSGATASGFSPSSFTIGPGVETSFDFFFPLTFDFAAGSLTMRFQGPGISFSPMPFNGFDFTTAMPHGISGVSVAGTALADFTVGDVTITSTGISVNLEGLRITPETPVVIDFTVTPRAVVPAPAALGLMGLGLLALVAARTPRRLLA